MNIQSERVFQILGQLFVENTLLREELAALRADLTALRAETNGDTEPVRAGG